MRYYFDQPVRVSFSVPSGWLFSATNQQSSVVMNAQATTAFGWFTVNDLAPDPCHWQNGMVEPPIGPSVDDLLGALEHLSGYVASGPVSETLGGLPAQRLLLTPTFDEATCDQGHSALGLYLPGVGGSGNNITNFILYAGGKMTLWVLEVRGTRLLVLSWTRTPGVGVTAPDVRAIARSIRFP